MSRRPTLEPGTLGLCEHLFLSGGATILHADLDAFFASVEQRDDPRLRAQPVIVGGGVVIAASYEARAFGVRSAMGGAQARRLCPQTIIVAPRFEAYVEASRAVFTLFDETSPVVEGLSIDEAFLDVRGLEEISGSPLEIATRLRATVREQVGLALTIGIASTKLLAKVVSAAAKARRTAARRCGRGDRVPASAACRAPVGSGGRDREQAAGPRNRVRRRHRTGRRGKR